MAPGRASHLLLSLRPVESVAVISVGVAVLIGRALLGTVFIVAGVGKVRSGPTRVQAAVLAYDLLPRSLGRVVAGSLPYVEIGTGVLVLAGLALGTAVLTAAGLLVIFTAVVAIALVRGTGAACGCFGRSDLTPLRKTIVVRNLVLLGIAGSLVMWPQPLLTVDGALAAAGVDQAWSFALALGAAAAAATAAAISTSRRSGFLLTRESATGGVQQ